MSENEEGWNSVATCQKCGLPLDQCTCSPAEKKVDRKILIEHKYSNPKAVADELKRLKEENQNYKSIIAIEAEKTFNTEKKAILERFPEERRQELSEMIGDNSDILENVRVQLAVNPPEEKQSGRRAPKGKAGLPNQTNGASKVFSGKDEYQEYIDSLYHDAKLGESKQVRVNAERQIDELFDNYQKGFRERDYNFGGRETRYTMSQCIKCGSFLSGRDAEVYTSGGGCPICNYKSGYVKYPHNLPPEY